MENMLAAVVAPLADEGECEALGGFDFNSVLKISLASSKLGKKLSCWLQKSSEQHLVILDAVLSQAMF